MTEDDMFYLSHNDTFRFSCSDDVACFNECCRDLNQFLTPYDILRLKNRLDMPSGLFLKRYTTTHTGPESGLPVITFKTDSASGKKCPFVTDSGCSVYKDRPSSCRMYPLARAISRSRETGEIKEHYMLLKERHCLGFNRGKKRNVREWTTDQEISVYNKMNDMLMEIISLKNRFKPGPLDIKSTHLFHMACYDLDRFRTHIFEKGLLDNSGMESDILDGVKNDDVKLLKLGFRSLKHLLFHNTHRPRR